MNDEKSLQNRILLLAQKHPDIFKSENPQQKAVEILETLLSTSYGKSQISLLTSILK